MAWSSDLVRTKNWGTEVLTDSDLEGQFDLIITWLMASLNSSTGHDHSGTGNLGKKISPANLLIASQAQGDLLYASSATVWARLGAGTAGQVLKTGGASANPSWATIRSIGGSTKNLKIVRTNVTTVTVTADEIALNDGTVISSVSEAIAITASGASGLDTGAEAANTIYYIWIIRKSSDGTVNGLLSTASAIGSVTLPSGYDQYALVGCVGNNDSSNFIDFIQEGNQYFFSSWPSVVTSEHAGTVKTLDLTPSTLTYFVPSALSSVCFGTIYVPASKIAGIGNLSGMSATIDEPNKFHGQNLNGHVNWRLNVITADSLYYYSDDDNVNFRLGGFIVNKLPLG